MCVCVNLKEWQYYKAVHLVLEVSGSGSGCQSGYRSGDLRSYDTPVWEVSGSGPGCQCI